MDETELKGDYKVALDIKADTRFAMNLNMARSIGLLGGGAAGRGRSAGRASGGPVAPPNSFLIALEMRRNGMPEPTGDLSILFQAVQKLGLKLQPGRAPIDTIMVDQLEKTPSEN